MAYVIGDNCVNCGTCADACPLGIISEGDGISADAVMSDYNLRWELLFLSDPEAGFGIMLEYRKFSSDVNGHGTNFIYDRDLQRYFPVGDTLEQYFIGDEETETSAG